MRTRISSGTAFTALALLAALGCSGDDGAAAGRPCELTADCRSGLLCVGGVCTDPAADADTDADTDGDSDSDSDTDADVGIGCEDFEISVELAAPADLVLAVDRSGSMSLSMPDGGSKWDAMLGAVDAVTRSLEDRIDFGLASFPAPGDEDLCSGGAVIVEPARGTADEIVARLTADGYGGGTPTAATLEAVGDWLATAREGHEGHPPTILLATDGGPGCNGGLDPATCACMGAVDGSGACALADNCLDDARTYEAIDGLQAGDPAVPVWVVGLPGTESYTDVLSEMARRGGTARAVDPVYYDARSPEELAAAFEEIAASLVSCTFTLDVPPEDPDGLRVFIDDEEVPESVGGSDGWRWVGADFTTLELLGRFCEMLSDGATHDVAAYYDCDTVG